MATMETDAVVDYSAALHALTELHPVKRDALRLIAEHGTRSPKQIADELGLPLPKVAYHVVALRDAKLIVLAHRKPRRGAVEHFYRLTEKARR